MQTALIVFFIAFVASRYILLNALKKLTEEEKASLLSSKIITQSQTRLLIVFGVLGIYYFAITTYPRYAKQLLAGFFVLIFTERIFTFISTYNKLKKAALPAYYIKAFITSSAIYNVGIIVFFFLLIKDYL